MAGTKLRIEIAWVAAGAVQLQRVSVPAGSLLSDALERAATLVPADVLTRASVAVFGRRRRLDEPLFDGDRIEILGPLLVDPKKARRHRVERKRSTMARDRWNPGRYKDG